MSKLNHSRPQLRYNDNLRRELSKSFSLADAKQHHLALFSNLTTGKPVKPKYLQQFEALSPQKQAIMNYLLEALVMHMDALIVYIPTILGGAKKGKKKALDKAHENLVLAGAIFVREALIELATGESGVWRWLQELAKGRDVHWRMSFSDLYSVLEEDSLPVYVDWALENEPEFLPVTERMFERVGT